MLELVILSRLTTDCQDWLAPTSTRLARSRRLACFLLFGARSEMYDILTDAVALPGKLGSDD